jgi:RNA polymerase sigma factor (sigma-70 family)
MTIPTHQTAVTHPAKATLEAATDAELMNQITAAGGRNDRSFEKLSARYEYLILNRLRRLNVRPCDRDELLNSVLIVIWRISRDGKWQAGRSRHGSDPFLPLLGQIIRSTAFDFHRNTRRQKKRTKQVVDAMQTFGMQWQAHLATASSQQARGAAAVPAGVPQGLEEVLVTLPEKFRRVFILHAEGKSNRAIATVVGCSPGEVSKRLAKAKAMLRETVDRKWLRERLSQ